MVNIIGWSSPLILVRGEKMGVYCVCGCAWRVNLLILRYDPPDTHSDGLWGESVVYVFV